MFHVEHFCKLFQLWKSVRNEEWLRRLFRQSRFEGDERLRARAARAILPWQAFQLGVTWESRSPDIRVRHCRWCVRNGHTASPSVESRFWPPFCSTRLLFYLVLRPSHVQDSPACSRPGTRPGNLVGNQIPCHWPDPPRKLTGMSRHSLLAGDCAHCQSSVRDRAFRKCQEQRQHPEAVAHR